MIAIKNKRADLKERCRNIKMCCRVENERLKRKLKCMQIQMHEIKTVTGSIYEIEKDLKYFKKERREILIKINKIKKEININFHSSVAAFKLVDRIEQMEEMEEDLKFYKQFAYSNTKVKANNKIKITDPFLQQIHSKLPDVILDYIQEYFHYDTKCALLEQKYNPLRIINNFKSNNLKEIINYIYRVDVIKHYNLEVNKYFIDNIYVFYNYMTEENENIKMKRSINDEKTFLSHTLVSYRDLSPHILYNLYKFIVFYDKDKNSNY